MLLKNQKGSAMIVALIVMLVSSLLGSAMYQYSTASTMHVAKDEKHMQAYYLARSGADAVAEYIIKNPDQLTAQQMIDFLSGAPESSEANLGNGRFKVKVSRDDINNSINIISTGYIDNDTQVPVTLTLSETLIAGTPPTDSTPVFDMATFTSGDIRLSGGARIVGEAGTGSIAPSSVRMDGGAKIEGDLYIGEDGDPENVLDIPNWASPSDFVTGNIEPIGSARSYVLPPYPEFPDLQIRESLDLKGGPSNDETIANDGDCYFEEITISSGRTLTIDVGSTERNIRVGTLDVKQGDIIIEGTGKFNLYVDDTFSMGGSSKINAGGNTSQITMYYNGNDEINLSGSTEFIGSVYANTANIDLAGSGQVKGNIITGGTSVKMSGGSSAIVRGIFAPNAQVNFSGGATFKGAIIAAGLEGVGGAVIDYEPLIEDFPLPIEDLSEGGSPGTPDTVAYERQLWQ